MLNYETHHKGKRNYCFTRKILATAMGAIITGMTGSMIHAQEVPDEGLEEIQHIGVTFAAASNKRSRIDRHS